MTHLDHETGGQSAPEAELDDICPNCGGEGVVYSCLDEIGCVNPEDGCDLCERRCDWCQSTNSVEVRSSCEACASVETDGNDLQQFAGILGGLPVEARAPDPAGRQCRVCGCTQENACQTEDGPCFWLEDDLCSGCLDAENGDV
ncbi:MAG: hypothetical protein KF765_12355 [Parvibaculaceae bacterium]|nr:hypothetical protein [Parvibaculaceae bacterium]